MDHDRAPAEARGDLFTVRPARNARPAGTASAGARNHSALSGQGNHGHHHGNNHKKTQNSPHHPPLPSLVLSPAVKSSGTNRSSVPARATADRTSAWVSGASAPLAQPRAQTCAVHVAEGCNPRHRLTFSMAPLFYARPPPFPGLSLHPVSPHCPCNPRSQRPTPRDRTCRESRPSAAPATALVDPCHVPASRPSSRSRRALEPTRSRPAPFPVASASVSGPLWPILRMFGR